MAHKEMSDGSDYAHSIHIQAAADAANVHHSILGGALASLSPDQIAPDCFFCCSQPDHKDLLLQRNHEARNNLCTKTRNNLSERAPSLESQILQRPSKELDTTMAPSLL